MRLTWIDKVRAISFEHMYMLEAVPDPLPEAPPHAAWQAPFVFASPDESLEQLAARAFRAGELWLDNHDLRPHNELIIAHRDIAWFMGFQRAAQPDETPIRIGPLHRRVLRPLDAQPLFALPLVFRESPQATSRELWRQLVRK